MATPTKFLDLPNELLESILRYLSGKDIVNAFFEIKSIRLRHLIQPFVQSLDVSDRSLTWVQHYLPLFVAQYGSRRVCLRDEQLKYLVLVLAAAKAKSVQILSQSADEMMSQAKHLAQLTRQSHKLSIEFSRMEEDTQLTRVLFNMNSRIQDLAIQNCTLYFEESHIDSSQYLKSLSIEIEGIHHLFFLLKRLHALEKLQVRHE